MSYVKIGHVQKEEQMPFAKNKNWKFIYLHLSYNLSTPEDNKMKQRNKPCDWRPVHGVPESHPVTPQMIVIQQL